MSWLCQKPAGLGLNTFQKEVLSNSYTKGCLTVRGDNP